MIHADKLSFEIGDFQLRSISLEVAKGQYFVLLGPPGSGKTIFLECLCGLKQIDSGQIYIEGRDVTKLEPRARGIGYVPQDYALFPHLSVTGNIEFGLRTKKQTSNQIQAKVKQTAQMLGISGLLKRRIAGLSGGEKQRVALARALVLEPKVLLLDEPVCALDEATRQDICAQLLNIQRQLDLTVIHVSHNQEEAFSVADRAGILHQGALQQVGSPDQLLRKPQSEFIARFMRCENLFQAQVIDKNAKTSHTRVKVAKVQLLVPGRHQDKIKFMVRPEDILVFSTHQQNIENENQLHLTLVRWRDYGSFVRVELNGSLNLVAHLSHAAFAELKAEPQSEVTAVLRPQNIHVLP